jgi:hypothetical protein
MDDIFYSHRPEGGENMPSPSAKQILILKAINPCNVKSFPLKAD